MMETVGNKYLLENDIIPYYIDSFFQHFPRHHVSFKNSGQKFISHE